jgi:signal transduction histidine kinase/CheY-like chemotaxis protein
MEQYGASLVSILDVLPEPVHLTDGEGILVFANRAAVTRLGSDKDIGVPLTQQLARRPMLRPDGSPRPVAEHPVARAVATGEAVPGVPVLIETASGRRDSYVVTSTPLVSEDRVVGTISVFRDVTAATWLEHEPADHTERLEAIVNLVGECVFVVDAAGGLQFANALGRRLLGADAGGNLDSWAQAVALRDVGGTAVARADLPWRRALRSGAASGVELLITDPGGAHRRIATRTHALRRPDGEIYAALILMKDVTDEVRARAEAEQARESAEEANRLKDEFIAALSHELRTPLQPILGWTEVLRRHGNLDAVTTKALEAIGRNIRQQVRLVDDLLDLSRIVHGKFPLRFETVDLRELVRTAAEPFEEVAALKRIRLTLLLPEKAVPLWGDGARLQQIAANLISNAVKFTPTGGQVSVNLVAGETEALLEVEDTGEGIPPEDVPIIFEAFRQGSMARRRGGLGIGLDLVKRLTELHGGAVSVVSEGPGYGARFQARFPLTFPRTQATKPRLASARRLAERSILLIEDNDDTREVLRYMLEVEGARVATAASGREGLTAAGRVRPEVVLCDIGLPDIDGLEVARLLRQQHDLVGTRLIALTGYGRAEDAQRAVEAGFETHLTKPINLEQLLTLLAA